MCMSILSTYTYVYTHYIFHIYFDYYCCCICFCYQFLRKLNGKKIITRIRICSDSYLKIEKMLSKYELDIEQKFIHGISKSCFQTSVVKSIRI